MKIIPIIPVVSLILLLLINKGTISVGRIINKFSPCQQDPQNSFPCYGSYDIGVMGLLVIAIVISLVAMVVNYYSFTRNQAFLDELKGEILFTDRDEKKPAIYKISANGKNKQLLYQMDPSKEGKAEPPQWFNAQWSEDGTKISFTVYRLDEKGELIYKDIDNSTEAYCDKVTIDEHGQVISREEGDELETVNWETKSDDLEVGKDGIYYLDNSGAKKLIFGMKNMDHKLGPNISNVSWSPDRNYVVFELFTLTQGSRIMVANKEGTKAAVVVQGQEPDWKY